MNAKLYVDVTAVFSADGVIVPVSIRWKNGTVYPIDKVLDKRPAAALKAGGCGMRYTCCIGGHIRYLFLEQDRWFLENSHQTQ